MPLTDSEIHEQASRCMDCGTPFCHGSSTGCPLGNVIPELNEAVYNGHWKEALDLLLATNVFPEFTGRICPAPCEGACVLGLIRPAVNICKIELAIIEQGFRRGYVKAEPCRVRRAERVAVVGSGPAGLATAQVLNRAGYNVTVYEKDARPGGLLRYGIPDFKLEKWVVDQRIDLMASEGVQFQCGVNVGDDISYKYLRDRYEAIVLAGGAGVPRDLAVPGRELGGIHFAMEFLTQQNRLVGGEPLGREERISAAGKNVVVIGGGDTGSDCIGTARRQGAADVVQLEILPEPPATRSESTPWPQWPLMLRESSSHKEGATPALERRHHRLHRRGRRGQAGTVRGGGVGLRRGGGAGLPAQSRGLGLFGRCRSGAHRHGLRRSQPHRAGRGARHRQGFPRLHRPRRASHDQRRGRVCDRRHAQWGIAGRACYR